MTAVWINSIKQGTVTQASRTRLCRKQGEHDECLHGQRSHGRHRSRMLALREKQTRGNSVSYAGEREPTQVVDENKFI